MKLSLIIENVDKMVQHISQRDKIEPEQIKEIITTYSPNPKYNQFILRQWYTHNVRLPEDGNRIKETLTNFNTVKNKLQNKDLLSYKSLNDLENALEPFIGTVSKRQGGSDILDPTKLPGVVLHTQVGQYKSYVIRTAKALAELGEGTKWCTRGSYENCQAREYLKDYGWIGQIWDGNKPIIQYTPDYTQIMDRNDEDVESDNLDQQMRQAFVAPTSMADPIIILNYYGNIIHSRAPEIENDIINDIVLDIDHDGTYNEEYSRLLLKYTRKAIKGRWPALEEIFLKYGSEHMLYEYARDPIKGRWPEAEQRIIKGPTYVPISYAAFIIRGRWPEFERYIIDNNPDAVLAYARQIIGRRWPEAEPTILRSPSASYMYALKVIKGRWPEAEPTILNFTYSAIKYMEDVLKQPWPELEQRLKESNRYGAETDLRQYYNAVKSFKQPEKQ